MHPDGDEFDIWKDYPPTLDKADWAFFAVACVFIGLLALGIFWGLSSLTSSSPTVVKTDKEPCKCELAS
jgi:hypothetical protein